jgi:hypothetical protein
MLGLSRPVVVTAALSWCALAAFGVRALYAYSTDAGAQLDAPALWPTTTLPHAQGRAELVMFVHPECPCSRASISELVDVVRAVPTTTELVVAFVDGSSAPPFGGAARSGEAGPFADEDRGALWDAVGAIPGIHRVVDRGGAEAQRFGARTSGHVVVYDAAGALRFQGGITGSRGHVGDNVGHRDVVAILNGNTETTRHAVFGCGLVDEQ